MKYFAQRVMTRRTQNTRSSLQRIRYYRVNQAPCGASLMPPHPRPLFLLTVIPGGGGTSDVTCIADLSSIEYMRTYKHNKTNENRYLSSSVTLCLTLHTAAEPAVRSAVKILVSLQNDMITAFFFATYKNKNSAQVPLASTSS